MKTIFLEAVECATSSHIPNKETIKALKNAKKRKNLVSVKEAKEINQKLRL